MLQLARSFAGEWLTANLAATITAGLILLPTILGQYFGGFLAERFDLRRAYLLFHAITIPAVLGMAHAFDLPLVLLAGSIFFLSARYTADRKYACRAVYVRRASGIQRSG